MAPARGGVMLWTSSWVASLKVLGAPWIFSTATNLLASPFNCVIKENVCVIKENV